MKCFITLLPALSTFLAEVSETTNSLNLQDHLHKSSLAPFFFPTLWQKDLSNLLGKKQIKYSCIYKNKSFIFFLSPSVTVISAQKTLSSLMGAKFGYRFYGWQQIQFHAPSSFFFSYLENQLMSQSALKSVRAFHELQQALNQSLMNSVVAMEAPVLCVKTLCYVTYIQSTLKCLHAQYTQIFTSKKRYAYRKERGKTSEKNYLCPSIHISFVMCSK